MADQRDKRLVELSREASQLEEEERETYLRKIRKEEPDLAQTVEGLLADTGPPILETVALPRTLTLLRCVLLGTRNSVCIVPIAEFWIAWSRTH